MAKNKWPRRLINISAIVTIVVGIILLSVLMAKQIADPIFQDRFEDFIRNAGPLGWLVIMLLQFIQIVVAPIPAEPIQIIAGALYDTWGGLVLMTLGSIPASILVYKVGEKYGKPLLYKVFGEEKVNKIALLNQSVGLELLAVVMFLIPAAPKDLFSYLCGISSMKYSRYLFISTLARIPATLLCTMMGDSLQEGQWEFVISSVVIMVLVIYLGVKFKDKLLGKNKKREM